ncbi:hypothetical protein C8J57DRAFT_1074364, partial [Mycena rebaudengoi]
VVWKLRNECVISNEGVPATKPEVHNRWFQIINERLSIDRNLTSDIKHGKQYSLFGQLRTTKKRKKKSI